MNIIYYSSNEELFRLMKNNTSNDVLFKSIYGCNFTPYNDFDCFGNLTSFNTDFTPSL